VPQHLYRYDSQVMRVMLAYPNRLFEWRAGSGLPDDPHLLRADGSAWLGSSTSHEDEEVVWLNLTELEFEELRRRHQGIARVLRPGAITFPESTTP